MREFEIYANGLEGEPPAKWQRLEDHLRRVAQWREAFGAVSELGARWAWQVNTESHSVPVAFIDPTAREPESFV